MNSLSVETEQLRLALEAAQMGIWDWNLLTDEITWSSSHEQLFGLEVGSFDGTYATFAACIHPDDRASVAEMLNIARQEQQDYQQEFRIVWSDGSIYWIQGKGRFFYDETGQAVRMVGTVLDISDRKHMELALQDSENRLRAIIAAEPECVKLVAADGTLLDMNAAGLEMIEAQCADAAIGQSVYSLIAPEHRAAFQALNDSVCNDGNSSKLEFEIVGFKGTRRWLETHAVPLHNEADKTVVQLAVTRDITERKQVEKNLRSRVHQQAAVAKLGQLALADTDLNTLMDEAAFLVAQCLEVEYCQVLELLPDGEAMLLRAGVGWQAGLVGQATVSCDLGSQAGYTLVAQDPVIVEDLCQEKRFNAPPLLHEHQVVSGLSTIVPGKKRPYGVLGAHTTKQRKFTQDDIYFLQAVANVLAEAIARQSAEQVLRSSLQELANIKFALDESSIVAITDRRGTITYANDKFCEISQYSRAELIGQNHRILNSHYHPQAFFSQMWATVSQGQVWQGEIKNRAKDGTCYWVDTTIVPLLDEQEKPYQYIAIRTDITARKRAEAQLLTAKDELEIRVAERTAELIKVNEQLQLELDERKRAESALERLSRQNQLILNAVGEGLCGLDMQGKISFVNPAAATMLGYSVTELSGRSIYTILQRSPADEPPNWSKLPIYESLRDGSVHQVSNEVFCRQDNSCFPVEYVSTPIREAEAIVGAVITFKDITFRQQIERMKDEFISVVSHELRTPLTSIHGSLGMLKSGLIEPSSERGKRLLEIATDSSDRLVRLINDILDIERIESGKVPMAKLACNAADLMAEAANVIQPIADKFGINLSVKSIEVKLWADSDRIIQTLTNLLSNAIKFSPPGSTVYLTAEIQAQQILFQVKDRGRGIPTDKLETIFERFQQVDASDSRDREGTGLGLAICRSIVQQHNGQIWVESTLGEGSIFSFTLPIPGQEQIAPDPKLNRPLVLVCDDDSRTRQTLENMLQQQKYGVVTVGSSQEAVKQAVRQQPDAIVLDLIMPGVNGWEVMASLKQHAATKDIPIVVCSVCSPESHQQEEFANWVVKPLDETLLLQSIELLVQSDRSSVRILLVEDDPDLAQLLITVFEERGVEIFLAKTGREAIQLSQQINPDLLILDLVLPDGNGFDVALWLSQHNYLHRLPLVVYSAKELDNFERDRLKLGQTEFLTKGRVSTQELEQRVMKLLQGITQKKMQDDGDGKTSFGS